MLERFSVSPEATQWVSVLSNQALMPVAVFFKGPSAARLFTIAAAGGLALMAPEWSSQPLLRAAQSFIVAGVIHVLGSMVARGSVSLAMQNQERFLLFGLAGMILSLVLPVIHLSIVFFVFTVYQEWNKSDGSSRIWHRNSWSLLFPVLCLTFLYLPLSKWATAPMLTGFSVVFGALFRWAMTHVNSQALSQADRVGTRWNKQLLNVAILSLAANIDGHRMMMTVGMSGVLGTSFVVASTMIVGLLLGRLFRTPWMFTVLLSAGMAICGGSAIAAASVALGLDPKNEDQKCQQSLALAVILAFNTLALGIFPFMASFLNFTMTQASFWFAWGIQDTNSVLQAAHFFDTNSVPLAATLKMARAAHIGVVSLLLSLWGPKVMTFLRGPSQSSASTGSLWKRLYRGPPLFIWGFMGVVLVMNFFPMLQSIGGSLKDLAKPLLSVVFFLIGSLIKFEDLKKIIHWRLVLQSGIHWIFLTATSGIVIAKGLSEWGLTLLLLPAAILAVVVYVLENPKSQELSRFLRCRSANAAA